MKNVISQYMTLIAASISKKCEVYALPSILQKYEV